MLGGGNSRNVLSSIRWVSVGVGVHNSMHNNFTLCQSTDPKLGGPGPPFSKVGGHGPPGAPFLLHCNEYSRGEAMSDHLILGMKLHPHIHYCCKKQFTVLFGL